LKGPEKIYCDSKSVINIAHNIVKHGKTKNVEVNRHLIKEKLDIGLSIALHVPTQEQLAQISRRVEQLHI